MRLTITTSLTPNILSHIYAAAGLTRYASYHKRFRHTLRNEDIDFLRPLTLHFRGKSPMAGGPLFLPLFQIPSYFPAESLEETMATIDLILEGLEKGSIEFMFLDEDTANALEVWMPTEIIEASRSEMKTMLGELSGILTRLKDIITYTYRSFYEEHWKSRRPVLIQKAGEMTDELKGLPIFEAWSEAFDLDFPYKEFVVYLCDAMRGGTSLLAEKLALPSGVTSERAVDTIIHEIGIHFIIAPGEYLKRGLTPRDFLKNAEKIGRMEESVTCHFKRQVYERLGLTLKEDYHLPLMKIEGEIQRFAEVWESEKPTDVFEAILKACRLI